MKKNIAVDFSGEIPRILTGYSGEAKEGIVLNPNLLHLKGSAPHCWYLKNGEIVKGPPREIKEPFKASFTPGREEPKVITKEIIRVIKPEYIDRTRTVYLNKDWHSLGIIFSVLLSLLALFFTTTK